MPDISMLFLGRMNHARLVKCKITQEWPMVALNERSHPHTAHSLIQNSRVLGTPVRIGIEELKTMAHPMAGTFRGLIGAVCEEDSFFPLSTELSPSQETKVQIRRAFAREAEIKATNSVGRKKDQQGWVTVGFVGLAVSIVIMCSIMGFVIAIKSFHLPPKTLSGNSSPPAVAATMVAPSANHPAEGANQ